jgi:hypothetical protein
MGADACDGRTTAYIIPREKDEQLISRISCQGSSLRCTTGQPGSRTRELNTYITHEPQLVNVIEVMLQCHFVESTRIFEQFSYETKDAYINSLVAALEKDNNEYHWSLSFPICHLPEGMLREILAENGISGEELEQDLEKINLIGELGAKSTHCYFIDLEPQRLAGARQHPPRRNVVFVRERHPHQPRRLSEAAGRGAQDHVSTDSFKLCLARQICSGASATRRSSPGEHEVSFLCAQCDQPKVLVTKELTVVTLLYQYFEELWNSRRISARTRSMSSNRLRSSSPNQHDKTGQSLTDPAGLPNSAFTPTTPL